jgi:malate dehydrogenase
MAEAPFKIAVVGGAGGVGSSLAFNLLIGDGAHEVVLIDPRSELVESHVLDLEQVVEQGATGSVRGGGLEEVADADVVVMAAGAPLGVNTSRMVYLEDNARLIEPALGQLGPDFAGVLIVVTNPVDPLCTWALSRIGLDRRRVIGYTMNDTLRFRSGIAKALAVEPGRVEAWVIGEHGDGSVPLFQRVSVDGAPAELSPTQRASAEGFLRGWYVRHVALDCGRSSTWTSGFGVARLISALRAPSDEPWTASVMLEGEYGVRGVSLGVPVSLGPAGVERIHEWPLDPEQRAAFQAAAGLVRGAAESLAAGAASRG